MVVLGTMQPSNVVAKALRGRFQRTIHFARPVPVASSARVVR